MALLSDGRLSRHPRRGEPKGPECPRSHTAHILTPEPPERMKTLDVESPERMNALDVASLLERVECLEKTSAEGGWKKAHVVGVWLGVAMSLIFSSLSFFQGPEVAPDRKPHELSAM